MKIGCYIGIDIGTTKTKAVCVATDGEVTTIARENTPVVAENGVSFFDLTALERIVDGLLYSLKSEYDILGVSFASVGESVVPVKERVALANPLMWYESVTESTEREVWPTIQESLEIEGIKHRSDFTLSLYKILWMRENLEFPNPECWLPLSSYFIYRYTGEAFWDFSQASRTMLLDVNKCEWNNSLLGQFHLGARLSGIRGMGTFVGSDRQGVPYFLGGHDHLAGLFGARIIVGGEDFILDSVGTSESAMTLSKRADEKLARTSGFVGAAFGPGQFYLLKGFRFSGKVLEWFARLAGAQDIGKYYEGVNSTLAGWKGSLEGHTALIVGGDPVMENGPDCLSLLNVPIDSDGVSLTHSIYVYVASMARLIIEDLENATKSEQDIVVTGPITTNTVFMEYRASVLGRPIRAVKTGEAGAVGAAVCAAVGNNDRGTVNSFARRQEPAVIDPLSERSKALRAQSDDVIREYRELREKGVIRMLFW